VHHVWWDHYISVEYVESSGALVHTLSSYAHVYVHTFQRIIYDITGGK
jgi:hypothetical protein